MSITITSDTSDALEIAKIVVEVVRALAWPVVVLTIALVFRSYIPQVIGRARGLEWGSFKISFEERLETAEEKATSIPPDAAEAQIEERPTPSDVPPDYIVLEAWRPIEVELAQLAERSGQSTRRGSSPLFRLRSLQSAGVIDSQTASLLNDLRALRNVAVHQAGSVTPEQAGRFQDLAELALVRLRQGHS